MLTALNVTTATTTTITGTTDESLIMINNLSGSVTFYLPDARLMKGRLTTIATMGSSVINNVLIKSAGGLVSNVSTVTISSSALVKTIYISDGFNWY